MLFKPGINYLNQAKPAEPLSQPEKPPTPISKQKKHSNLAHAHIIWRK